MSEGVASIEVELKRILKTGKVIIGAKKSIRAIKLGKAKGVILASKIPKEIEDDVLYYARLSNIKVIRFHGSSHELGMAIGKPFPVTTIAVIDSGDSTLFSEGGE